jgi:hypothetical protein
MYLYLDVHGLIFETSVWLLAESTRLLPFSFKHGLPQTTNSRTTVQKLTRDLHLWTTRHCWTVSVFCNIPCMSSNFGNDFCLQEDSTQKLYDILQNFTSQISIIPRKQPLETYESKPADCFDTQNSRAISCSGVFANKNILQLDDSRLQ